MADLTSKVARSSLKERREPYWTRLHKGCFLGYRRGPNTWIARYTYRESGKFKYRYKAIEAEEYDQASKIASAWFAKQGSAAARVIMHGSVRDALATYVEILREQGRHSTADNAEDRFRLIVDGDAIAELKLEDLTRQDVRQWRERLRKGRQNRSVNRHVRGLVAGLNVAVREGHIGNPEAWKVEPLADDAEADGETTVFLTPDQRSRIIEAASAECADFLRAIQHTGGRPGELAAATVGDFDRAGAVLTLRHKKGRPAKLRPRAVVLSEDGADFFRRQCRGKLPAAPLLQDPEGKPWGRHKWADEVQAAIASVNFHAKPDARLPDGVSAYSFRHARISELLQDFGIDPLTVAYQTGTSLRMIEQNYFKFIPSAMRDKLAVVRDS